MNEKIAQYRAKIAGFWNAMEKKQKIWLGASVGILILTIVLLTYLFSRVSYEVAFQDLDSTDAAAVMEYLDTNKISYKLADAGQTIMVPAANAAKVKVEAGSQGLVRNGTIGFDQFNDSGSMFGPTDRIMDIQYRNALNGEIQKLLNVMQGVKSSNVLVNLPEETAFMTTEEKEEASASITMTFRPGYRPEQKEVDGYYNLVKTAIPHIKAENITISSPEGVLPSSNIGGNGLGSELLDEHYQIQRKFENDLKQKVQAMLVPMVGMKNLVVTVSSSFNFDKKKSDQSLVSPLENNNNNGIILSEKENSKTATGGTGGSGGVAGTGETDVPGYQATDATSGGSSEENNRETNYDYNKILNTIESAPYVIKDLSISVGVEKSALSAEAKTEMNNFLSTIIRSQLAESGQDVNNDALIQKKISIMASTFVDNGGATSSAILSTGWLTAIGVAALAIIGGLGYMVVRRRRQAALVQEMAETPGKVEYPTIDLENVTNENQVRKQLETLAKRKPEEFVNLLRTWLVDE
ncbi:flagellar basal-body MS-ring/collar protein FliF [Paenibacillus sp. OV219]|uniref:flagellar basal-body MS-ring/collar protein FliF n=1 Tax=Paenibacillus sp. OV219 TaxID=1884377 RepID=UPI0008CEAC5A|nr:flagellar basal-body MS-ring/collar protein FliF [Paenibacillus sp. OV219]SEN31738.1 flagellar M-ring protein FliF [Paenibacillus sp. OV219]